MASIRDYLRQSDIQDWARFLNSEPGRRGLNYLRIACPRRQEKDDATLIRNSVGFDFWHEAIDTLEKLGYIPPKQEKQEDDVLET
jgi:hypothetical protein